MNIVVFGANGPTGQLLTGQALMAGHSVRAVTRRPETFPVQHPRLQVMGGDVFDLELVDEAVARQDTVLSTLGVPFGRQPITIYSQGIANIIEAMRRQGVRRLACVSSSSVEPNHETGGGFIFDKILLPLIVSTIGRTTYTDMRQMEKLVRNSGLDWTIVRPSGLFETPAVTDYRMAEGHIKGRFTSRADLANCLLQQAVSDQYVGKTVAVATFAVQPTIIKFIMTEAFKKPNQSPGRHPNLTQADQRQS